jgi:hypothetical protein
VRENVTIVEVHAISVRWKSRIKARRPIDAVTAYAEIKGIVTQATGWQEYAITIVFRSKF